MTIVGQEQLAACRSLTVTYGSGDSAVTVLSGVDLVIGDGERIGLWGPSGSGKTTLLHVLGGLVTPTSGEVIWRGQPLSSLDATARARVRSRGIAYVFQGANLLPTLTAFENVAFAAHASGGETDAVGTTTKELLELVGLDAKLDALPAELSGGEAQRVAIARALAQRPALLLCDEPTGQLDSATGLHVLDLMDALHQEFGFAQVTATHAADVAARFDRAVGLSDGRLTGEAQVR